MIELPNKITKGALTNGTKQLREIASSEQPFALPVIQQGHGQLGHICSLDAALSFLDKENVLLSGVSSLADLQAHLTSLVQEGVPVNDNEATLVTIGQKPKADAAGFIFYRGSLSAKLAEHAATYTNGNGKRLQHRLPVVSELNIDHPEVGRVLGRELRGGPKHTEIATESNSIVAQKDASFAGLNRQSGLELKAGMFPNNGEIIKDQTATRMNQNFGSIRDEIDQGATFARVILKDRWENITERDLTIVPGYAVEFLELDDSGTITGVKPATALHMTFCMSAEVDTDFTHKTRFRLNSKDTGKLALVERAMAQLRTAEERISLQGQARTVHELSRERRLSGTQGHIKFDTQIGVSFTLRASGAVDNFCIGTGTQNALIKHALKLPEDVSMIFRGRNYGLDM